MNTAMLARDDRGSEANARATRSQKLERLELVRRWLSDGLTRSEVLPLVMQNFRVGRRAAQMYVQKAEARVLREGSAREHLLTLTFSQELRGRMLSQLSNQLHQGSFLPAKELVMLVNATRTLLDARDRTAETLSDLRMEAEEQIEASPEPVPMTRRKRKPAPQCGPELERATPGSLAPPIPSTTDPDKNVAHDVAIQDIPAVAKCGLHEENKAAEHTEPVREYVARPPQGMQPSVGPRMSPAEMRKMLDMMDAMESMCQARGLMPSPMPRNDPDVARDPLSVLLRDDVAQVLPAVASPTPKSKPQSALRTQRAVEVT